MDDVTVTQALPLIRGLDDDATPDDHAEAIGLVYTTDDEPGYHRVRRGRGFSYHDDADVLVEGEERERIERLAIPPAWTDVWICLSPEGHLQATGRDDAGRKQYLYHPVWRQLREAAKFNQLAEFGEALPEIRDAVDAELRRRTLDHRKVVALAVSLLDASLIRVGNSEYVRANGAYGLTTLETHHIDVTGTTIRLSFRGKAGRQQELEVRNPRIARQLGRVVGGKGERVFTYEGADGRQRGIQADDVNDYLREIAGPSVSAKSFRTWGGTAVAAARLRDLGAPESPAEAKTKILDAVDTVAERLGNTRAVARASYIHPLVPKAYRFGHFDGTWDGDDEIVDGLSPAERAVGRMLHLELPPSSELEQEES